MNKILLLATLFFCTVNSIYSQAGVPDSSFGNNGIVTSSLVGITSTVVQSTGKILLAGATGITRYNSNGSLDNTFGNNGTVPNDFAIVSMAIQSNDKFVVAGSISNTFAVARYNNDGSRDNTFSDDGKQTTDIADTYDIAMSVAIQSDRKIVLLGRTGTNGNAIDEIVLVRYNTDGSLDNSFDNDGILNSKNVETAYDNSKALKIQTDGKILVAGSKNNDFGILRFNTNGSADNTFDGDGIKTVDFGNDDEAACISLQNDGKIVVSGEITYLPTELTATCVTRLNTDGSLDNSFSDDGKLIIDIAGLDDYFINYSLAIQDDNKILIGGKTGANFIIARYLSNGNLDNNFGSSGTIITGANSYNIYVSDLVISSNKLYAAQYQSSLARYNLTGNNNVNVTISTPADNSAYLEPGTINITARVTNSTAITKVEFYNGSSLLSTDITSPYNYSWINVPIGSYVLTAKATDTAGNSFYSNAIHVSVVKKQPPVIALSSPIYGTIYEAPATIKFEASATDDQPGGRIARVEFFNDITLLATDTSAPYTFNWTDVKEGEYILRAVTTDNTGLTASAAVYVSVFLRPTFGFTINGKKAYNINNGIFDSSEAITVSVCGSGEYTTSEIFQSSLSNFYRSSITSSGNGQDGVLRFGGFNPPGNNTIAAVTLNSLAGSREMFLENPNYGATVVQTLTPVSSGVTGDPIVITYIGYPILPWYLDADGDQHASQTTRSCTSPGVGWTLTPLPIDDCDDNDPLSCITIAPTVNIIHPVNDTTYVQPSPIMLSADAKDADGTIQSVDFYDRDKLIFTEHNEPYSKEWRNVQPGDHYIFAVATDNTGLKTTSEAVHIFVLPNPHPTVSITSPVNGATYVAPASILISAYADGVVKSVKFYNGTTLLRTERSIGYSWKWKNVPSGDYTITAVSTLVDGRQITSAPIHITVVNNQSPMVNITSPFNGASYTAHANVLIAANASDADGTIKTVEFYNGSTLLHIERYLNYAWLWKDVAPGTYTITAKATDNLGVVTTSAPVTITVTSPNNLMVSNRSSLYNKNDFNTSLSLSLSPNPARDILNVSAKGLQQNQPAIISIISSSGVIMKIIKSSGLNQTLPLNVSSLASGVYTVNIIIGDKIINKKFVKL